jgi:hypothetical protein
MKTADEIGTGARHSEVSISKLRGFLGHRRTKQD